MSGSGRKHVSKWDSMEDTHHNHSVDVISGSHHRDKEAQPVRFNAGSNASKRSAEDQHSNQARTRSRVSQNNDNNYYSEQDETRHHFSHRSDSRSRSRSRSPVYKERRDHVGSYYDKHKTRTRDEFNKRGSDYGWEDKARKPRETRYHSSDVREEAAMVMMEGARSSNYDDDTEERSRRDHVQHDDVSDPRLRRQRRDVDDGEGRFRRSSDIPCKFFAAGNCRNGQHCRFSHHGGGADRKQPQDNNSNFYRRDNNYHSDRWNGDERLDNGKFSKGGTKGNSGSNWIGDMEMSPDWNYGAHTLKNPMKKEESGVGIIGKSSKSRVNDQRSSDMYSHSDIKPMADSHQNYNIASVQAFNQNHNVLLYHNSLTPGGTQQQVIAPAATDYSAAEDNHHSVVEKPVLVQSSVTREQIEQISNISATIAQILANGQPIPHLTQALQLPLHSESSMSVQPNHATQSHNPLGTSTNTDEAPPVTASHVSNVDEIQELPVNPKASDQKTVETSKEEECKKTGEDVENVVDEDDDGSDEEEDKKEKEKDTKGMRTFKFALVEIVKELLKPAWKEGKMKKDGYKNIVKKVVEKVTGSMQSGNVPQTQEKIDHYLSASKPKLTKLVQAYISKVKKT